MQGYSQCSFWVLLQDFVETSKTRLWHEMTRISAVSLAERFEQRSRICRLVIRRVPRLCRTLYAVLKHLSILSAGFKFEPFAASSYGGIVPLARLSKPPRA